MEILSCARIAVLTLALALVPSTALANPYRVRLGDTIARIARRLGCSQRALREANHIDRAAVIGIGQTLRIPGPEADRRGPISSNPRIGSLDMAYFLLSNQPVGKLRRLH